MIQGEVAAVCRRPGRHFGKTPQDEIILIAGIGVRGDIHAGETIRHAARMKKDPTKPNLRQVHFLHIELLDDLAELGISVSPGAMGENILTKGIDLLSLPRSTILRVGDEAVLRVEGLRNPCRQLDAVDERILPYVLRRDVEGGLTRLSGIMTTVTCGGVVRRGDTISAELPSAPHEVLEPV